jgi:hypothetical protein
MTVIYINDQLCDLYLNTVVAVSLKTLAIGDLSGRYSNRTNNVKLPKTNNNLAIFGNIDNVASASRDVYTTNTARILINGVEIINNGEVVINSIDSSINITIYSGIYGFIKAIGDKELKDLTDANADAAVLGNMVMSSGTAAEYFFSLPISKYSNIIEAIISESGFTKAGSVFSSNDYLRMILIYGRDSNELNTNFALEKQFKAINTGDSLSPSSSYVRFTYDTIIDIGDLNMFASSLWSTDNATDYAFEFTLQADINLSVSGGSGDVRIAFNRDGAEVGTPVDITTGSSANVVMEYTATHSAGLDYDYGLGYKHQSGSGSTITVTEVTYQVIVNKQWLGIVTVGSSDVQNKYMLPDMTQLDFLKEFMKFYGLFPVETNKTVTFKTIEYILNDRSNAVDWSGKRVKTQDSIEFISNGYGQDNTFTYTPFDKDAITGADYTSTIDNINLTKVKNVIKSMFSDSETIYKEPSGGDWINMIHVPSYTGSDIEGSGMRIAMYRGLYSGESSALSNVAYFKEPRESYEMTWEYFYTNYYATLFSILQDIKFVRYTYNLNETDIANFDPSLLIYDNGFYYSFPEIDKYIPGKLTEVQMLKI